MDSTILHFDWLCFSVMVSPLHREVSLGTILICGCKDKYLKCSLGLCWLSKVVVVDSPLRFMTSLALVCLFVFKQFIAFIYLLCACVYVWAPVPQYICRGQRTAFRKSVLLPCRPQDLYSCCQS